MFIGCLDDEIPMWLTRVEKMMSRYQSILSMWCGNSPGSLISKEEDTCTGSSKGSRQGLPKRTEYAIESRLSSNYELPLRVLSQKVTIKLLWQYLIVVSLLV